MKFNDAGENFASEKACKYQYFCIKIGYSGPQTPQRNNRVEQKSQILYRRIRAMLNDAGVDGEFVKDYGLNVLLLLLILRN